MFNRWGPKKPKKKPVYKGISMASKKECEFAEICDKKKIKWVYEPDRWQWWPPRKVRNYTPDFRIICKDKYEFLVEYKGYLRAEDKLKMACIKEQYPDLDIRFIFQDPNKPVAGARVRKDGTKQSHREWAEKHKYIWAGGFMPTEWLQGKRFINRLKKIEARKKTTTCKKTKVKYTNRPIICRSGRG